MFEIPSVLLIWPSLLVSTLVLNQESEVHTLAVRRAQQTPWIPLGLVPVITSQCISEMTEFFSLTSVAAMRMIKDTPCWVAALASTDDCLLVNEKFTHLYNRHEVLRLWPDGGICHWGIQKSPHIITHHSPFTTIRRHLGTSIIHFLYLYEPRK